MKQHGLHPLLQCPLYSAHVSDFDALSNPIPPAQQTILLIAADAREVASETIKHIASRFVRSGLLYVCLWGPDCKRIHDLFDAAYLGEHPDADTPYTFMSTWHDDESLEEALYYFLFSIYHESANPDSTACVAIAINSPEWDTAIGNALSNPNALS